MEQIDGNIILRGSRAHSQLYQAVRDLMQTYAAKQFARSHPGYDSLLLTKCRCVYVDTDEGKSYMHYAVLVKVPGKKRVVGSFIVTLGVSNFTAGVPDFDTVKENPLCWVP